MLFNFRTSKIFEYTSWSVTILGVGRTCAECLVSLCTPRNMRAGHSLEYDLKIAAQASKTELYTNASASIILTRIPLP